MNILSSIYPLDVWFCDMVGVPYEYTCTTHSLDVYFCDMVGVPYEYTPLTHCRDDFTVVHVYSGDI